MFMCCVCAYGACEHCESIVWYVARLYNLDFTRFIEIGFIIRITVEPLINGHIGDKEFCPLQGGVRYWECLT